MDGSRANLCVCAGDTELQDIAPDVVEELATPPQSSCLVATAERVRCCVIRPPSGIFASIITYVALAAVLFGAFWSVTQQECLPKGKLFGVVVIFISAVAAGKLVELLHFPPLPPFPPLLGMLLAGLLLHNLPVLSEAVLVPLSWSSALRNVALAVILTRAGLGLDAAALRRLKAVCVRVALGPCSAEACTVAVVSHFLMGLPWIWAFMLGFVLSAVSPAVVVPSMLALQKEGLGVEKGVPTLLMAAGSFDDILSITGFSACLGVAFATASTWQHVLKGFLEVVGGVAAGCLLGFFLRFFPSRGDAEVVQKRSFLLLGLSVFAVFSTRVFDAAGAGGVCALVASFLAGLGWEGSKVPVAAVVGVVWDIFQPLLFGLIGAEVTLLALDPNAVGLGVAALFVGLIVRLLVTFTMALFAGFNFKEKVFIALAWMPKATVQAAIGSTALDMARSEGDPVLVKYGSDILAVAVLSILITAPVGALGIGLSAPRLLQRQRDEEQVKHAEVSVGQQSVNPVHPSHLHPDGEPEAPPCEHNKSPIPV